MEERNARVFLDLSDGRAAMTEHAVVIAGGGPTGMMLAGELALAGVEAAIERLAYAPSVFPRDLSERDLADHGRLDRRAAGADLLRV